MQSKHIKPVLIIFVIAIIARIIFYFLVYQPVANSYNPGLLHPPGVFSWQSDDKYDEIAGNLVAGRGYTIRGGTDNKLYPNLIRPPVYPYILAAQFYLFGDGYWINMLMNVIYQSLASVILYYMTLMMFNEKKIAIVSSLIWALYPLPMLNAMGPLTESVYVLFLVAFAYFFYKFYKFEKMQYLVYFSILLVIVTLTRPISLIFPLYFIAITLLMRKFTLRARIKYIVIVLLIFTAGITPWMYRGYKITGEIIPLVTYRKPINYYLLENNNKTSANYKKIQNRSDHSLKDIKKMNKFRDYRSKLMEDMKNPVTFLENFFVGSVRYWYYGHFKLTRLANAAMQFPLLLLSLTGMWWAKKNNYLYFPIILIICFFWLGNSAIALIPLAKYSFPIVILLCPFAAIGIINFFNMIVKRDFVVSRAMKT